MLPYMKFRAEASVMTAESGGLPAATRCAILALYSAHPIVSYLMVMPYCLVNSAATFFSLSDRLPP